MEAREASAAPAEDTKLAGLGTASVEPRGRGGLPNKISVALLGQESVIPLSSDSVSFADEIASHGLIGLGIEAALALVQPVGEAADKSVDHRLPTLWKELEALDGVHLVLEEGVVFPNLSPGSEVRGGAREAIPFVSPCGIRGCLPRGSKRRQLSSDTTSTVFQIQDGASLSKFVEQLLANSDNDSRHCVSAVRATPACGSELRKKYTEWSKHKHHMRKVLPKETPVTPPLPHATVGALDRLRVVASQEARRAVLQGAAVDVTASQFALLELVARSRDTGLLQIDIEAAFGRQPGRLKSDLDDLTKRRLLSRTTVSRNLEVKAKAFLSMADYLVHSFKHSRFGEVKPILDARSLYKALSACSGSAASVKDLKRVFGYTDTGRPHGWASSTQYLHERGVIEEFVAQPHLSKTKVKCLRIVKPLVEAPIVSVPERPLLAQVLDHIDGAEDDGLTLTEITDAFDLVSSFAIALLEFLVKNHCIVVIENENSTAWSASTCFASARHADPSNPPSSASIGATSVNSGRIKGLAQQLERRARILHGFVVQDGPLVLGMGLRRRIQRAEIDELKDSSVRLADKKVVDRIVGKLVKEGKMKVLEISADQTSPSSKDVKPIVALVPPDVDESAASVRAAVEKEIEIRKATKEKQGRVAAPVTLDVEVVSLFEASDTSTVRKRKIGVKSETGNDEHPVEGDDDLDISVKPKRRRRRKQPALQKSSEKQMELDDDPDAVSPSGSYSSASPFEIHGDHPFVVEQMIFACLWLQSHGDKSDVARGSKLVGGAFEFGAIQSALRSLRARQIVVKSKDGNSSAAGWLQGWAFSDSFLQRFRVQPSAATLQAAHALSGTIANGTACHVSSSSTVDDAIAVAAAYGLAQGTLSTTQTPNLQGDEAGLQGILAHLTTTAPDGTAGERKRSFPAERLVSIQIVAAQAAPQAMDTDRKSLVEPDVVARVVQFLEEAGGAGADEGDLIFALQDTPPLTDCSDAVFALWLAIVQMDVVCVGQMAVRYYAADSAPSADLADVGVSVIPQVGQEHFVRAPRPYQRRVWTAPWGECNSTALTELRRLVLSFVTRNPGISERTLLTRCAGSLTPSDLRLLVIHEWHCGNLTVEIVGEDSRGLLAFGEADIIPIVTVYLFPVSERILSDCP